MVSTFRDENVKFQIATVIGGNIAFVLGITLNQKKKSFFKKKKKICMKTTCNFLYIY